MTKEYILRELTLYKLGYPIDKDIHNYVELFNKLIGDPKKLKKTHGIWLREKVIIYSKNDIILFFYIENKKQCWMRYDGVWDNFRKSNYLITFQEISEIFSALFENAINYKVELSNWAEIDTLKTLIHE